MIIKNKIVTKHILSFLFFSISTLHLFSQGTDSAIYMYTKDVQTFTSPNTDSITIMAWGGGGGGGGLDTYIGGAGGGGAYIKSTIPVTKGQTFSIIVGGGGATGIGCVSNTGGGGGGWGNKKFNGGSGGDAGRLGCSGGGGGGGAGTAILKGKSIILVAGGGGGGGGGGNHSPGAIGGGGGQNGNEVNGSCNTPGIAGYSVKSAGTWGEDRGSKYDGGGGGGGGGGYLGGSGSGTTTDCDCGGCSGGGGSSWSSVPGAIIINGNGEVPGNNTALPSGIAVGGIPSTSADKRSVKISWSLTGGGPSVIDQNGQIPRNNTDLPAGSATGGNGYVKIIWKIKLPIASINGTTTVCKGASAPNITFTGANSIPPYTFTYTINGGADQTISTTEKSSTVTLAAPIDTIGTYTYDLVSVSTADGFQAQTGTASISLNPVQKEIAIPITFKAILFDSSKSIINDESKMELENIIKYLNENKNTSLEIVGYTDSKGTADYNLALSQKRASEILNYLVKQGINSERLKSTGMGEANPVMPNENADKADNPEGRKLNRRVEFVIIDNK